MQSNREKNKAKVKLNEETYKAVISGLLRGDDMYTKVHDRTTAIIVELANAGLEIKPKRKTKSV